LFGAFYAQWQGRGKPILIGQKGATTLDQAQYIQGMKSDLPSLYPDVKAVIYGDATGIYPVPSLSAFQALTQDRYFTTDRRGDASVHSPGMTPG
jgi:hypothetical protein